MNNKPVSIQIYPPLTSVELEAFDSFNQILTLQLKKYSPGFCIWLNEKNDVNSFEVIDEEKDKININIVLNNEIKSFKYYCNKEDLNEDFSLLKDFFSLSFNTQLKQNYESLYQMKYNSSDLSIHLFKMIHFFHSEGLFRKMFSINLNSHTFSHIVSDEISNKHYIVENLKIYNATLQPNGFFHKNDEILILDELWNSINKKIFKDYLESDLDEKSGKSGTQKI